MSPDTAARRHDSTVAQRPHENGTTGPDEARDEPARSDGPTRHGRLWTYLTFTAAAAFVGAVAIVGTNLFTGEVAEISDTPEHSVEEFLTALLDDNDAAAAREWMCEDKADRDLSEATAELATINERAGVAWANVTETDRSVGRATVTAELSTGDEAVTWTFTLIAENSDPQWQVCDMAVR